MDGKTWSIDVVPINGPDALREVTRGSDMQIVQLKPGNVRGSIKHFAIGNLAISVGRFGSAIRMRGTLHQNQIVLGTVLESAGRATQWWNDVRPGDIGIFPAGVEFDAIHAGGAAYLTVSIALPELLSMFEGDEHLGDPAFWNTRRLCRPDPLVSAGILHQLQGVISGIQDKVVAPSVQAADFLRRSIIEYFVAGLASASPQQSALSYTGARLVSEAENYMDAADGRSIHISELCSALRVSRRSLHRAFADTLGVGPAAYLRRRRLSVVHAALKRCDPSTTSIYDLAFEHGFPEPGRFAACYRGHFGETPAETLRSKSVMQAVLQSRRSVADLAQNALPDFRPLRSTALDVTV